MFIAVMYSGCLFIKKVVGAVMLSEKGVELGMLQVGMEFRSFKELAGWFGSSSLSSYLLVLSW